LCHASITTTGNVYVQPIDENVFRAVNSRANAVVEGWMPALEQMGRTGRLPKAENRKVSDEPFPTFPKLLEEGRSKLLQ
jgi:hypothetical protein